MDLTKTTSHANLGELEGAEQDAGQLVIYLACWITRCANVSSISDSSQTSYEGRNCKNKDNARGSKQDGGSNDINK